MENVEDLYVLSPVQNGMLFHSLYAPGSGVYVIQVSCRLHGDLKVAVLEKAWQEVLRRHAIMRSSFLWETLDQPLQVVHRQVEFPIEQHDWRQLDPGAQEAGIADWLKRDRQRGFELDNPPLMRLALVREGDDDYRVLWSYQHLLLDGWSMQLLLKEVFMLYEAYSRQVELPPPPTRQYRDYIGWLQQQPLAAAEGYWRKVFTGLESPTSIGKRRVRNATSQSVEVSYSEQRIDVSAKVTEQLQAFCRQQQLTFNTVIQAAWALLLMRYGRQRDVVFGTVVSGRPANLDGVERMVGPLINTLPVRVQADDKQQVAAWLHEIQDQGVEMRQYEYSPLVEVQRWSGIAPGEPLFESIVVYENYPVEETVEDEIEGLKLTELRSVEQTNYPLTLLAVPGEQLVLRIIYEQGRFEHDLIGQVLKQMASVMEQIATKPGLRVGELTLLAESERQQILTRWNQTAQSYPQAKPLHELFEDQAERTPDGVAVVFEGQQLTYRELNEKANQLAHQLRNVGVGPEYLVGVAVERSLEMVIALLATLKTGAAYLPLEPSDPDARLLDMIEDSKPTALLVQPHREEKFPFFQGRIICVDAMATVPDTSGENHNVEISADNLAYTIYTSGSTGKPKGAMNAHRGIVNRLLWMQDAYHLTAADRVLQKTPFTFDVSVWEFFWPLLNGATLVVARPGGHQDAAYLAQLIREQQVTIVHFVPSMLSVFLEQSEVASCTSLRHVICSGEALLPDMVERFFARFTAGLHNLYGPTEAAVDVTYWECELRDDDIVPIGHPIANTQMFVLDTRLNPVPVGVPGELYIGGTGLGRGYLNRPALTAEKFIPDPFNSSGGARLYRTGDLGQYLPDGAIAFLGRIDHQVKVSGHRIELGEIQSALLEYPSVLETVVTVQEVDPVNKRLVAYVVFEKGSEVAVIELRNYLKEKLPEYMVPSLFVELESLPLTSNGKLDRRALPAPDRTRGDSDRSFVPPDSPLEKTLAEIWAEVLGLKQIGIEDDFFVIGGHSLLAAQVISRIQRELGVELALRDFFTSPNIRSLAERIDEDMLSSVDESKIDSMLDMVENMDEDQVERLLAAQLPDEIERVT